MPSMIVGLVVANDSAWFVNKERYCFIIYSYGSLSYPLWHQLYLIVESSASIRHSLSLCCSIIVNIPLDSNVTSTVYITL